MNWTRLDLRSKSTMPKTGMLVALRMEPKKCTSHFYSSGRYDIGVFKLESINPKSRKLWWHGTRGVDNPTRLKQHYDIWWIPVREFDSYGTY